MSDDAGIRVEVIYRRNSGEDDEAERLSASELKTRKFLQAWRSHFADPITVATYNNADPETQLHISSASSSQVRIEQISPKGKIIYDYDNRRTNKPLHVTMEPREHHTSMIELPDSPVLQHEALSQLLFDCEHIEAQYGKP
jgi:hypothetical protein